MRIRKHAKISPLLYASSSLNPGTLIQTHVCQLNQSPWDVMTFSPPSSPPPPFQVCGSDAVGGNGSFISVTERELSNPPPPPPAAENEVILCCKTDGKSWQCRRLAAEGNSLCEHHLALIKSYGGAAKKSPRNKKPPPTSSSNPYEFYYYSGFGPRWSKRRGKSSNNTNPLAHTAKEEFDFVEYEDEEDEDEDEIREDNNGKKRVRKPIKARSLKSLL